MNRMRGTLKNENTLKQVNRNIKEKICFFFCGSNETQNDFTTSITTNKIASVFFFFWFDFVGLLKILIELLNKVPRL